MSRPRRYFRTTPRLESLQDFLLRAWAIRRAGWRARIVLLLVTAGVTLLTSWIDPIVRALSTLWSVEPVAFPEIPPWYGLLLIFLGMAFAVWSARYEHGLPLRSDRPDRAVILDQLLRESVARCTARFGASIASRDRVSELVARLDELPDLATSAQIPAAGRVSVLTGPLGSGKSLTAERLYQRAVRRARDPEAPLPVYLNARHVNGDLNSHVRETASEFGESPAVGAAVVIDQLDDLPLSDARQLYEEALTLAQSWPKTAVLLVARSTPWLSSDNDTTVRIREMTLRETERLMSAVSGSSTFYSLWELPETVRRSAQRPLFAILLAGYLSSRPTDRGASVGQLVDWMVRRAVASVEPQISTPVEAALRSLAVRLTDDRIAIPMSRISSSVVAEGRLLATRLVNVTPGGEVDFALPVLRQWFAYAALTEREVGVDDLARDPARLDRWTDVLKTAVVLAEERVDELLEPVVRHSPAVASLIIADALEHADTTTTDSTLTADEFGRELRNAMTAFVAGLGPLGNLIGPVDERGRVKPLGVRVTNDWYVTAWYEGTTAMPDVVDLSGYRSELDRDWPVRRLRRRNLSRGWAWLDAKGQLVNQLGRRLDEHGFPANNGTLVHELAWMMAMVALDRGSPFESVVSVEELQYILNGNWRLPLRAGRRLDPAMLPLVIAWLRSLVRDGEPLRAPWPGPDRGAPDGRGGFWEWDVYSPERMQERLRRVLTGALGIYGDVVSSWFPAMGRECGIFSLMPVRLVAHLEIDRSSRGPGYAYYFQPLGEGESSCAEVHLEAVEHEELVERARDALPADTVRVYSSAADIFGRRPATGRALGWLSRELSELKWTTTTVFPGLGSGDVTLGGDGPDPCRVSWQ